MRAISASGALHRKASFAAHGGNGPKNAATSSIKKARRWSCTPLIDGERCWSDARRAIRRVIENFRTLDMRQDRDGPIRQKTYDHPIGLECTGRRFVRGDCPGARIPPPLADHALSNVLSLLRLGHGRPVASSNLSMQPDRTLQT